MDNDLYKQIQKAFLELDITIDKHKEIIKSLSNKYDGFAITSDKEYDIIRKMVAPFNTDNTK